MDHDAAGHPTGLGTGGALDHLFEVFTPRRQCMNFEPDVVWTHFAADLVIALAYFSIPFALIYLVRRRRDLAFGPVFRLFALFIVLCGTTHLFSVVALWRPYYRLDGLVKAVTAGVSAATAVVLWRLMPRALRIPSVEALRLANERLSTEVAERKLAEAEVQRLNAELEARVAARTAELESLLTSAPLGVAFFDREHRYLRVNEVLARINGIPAAEHPGRTVAELLPANAPGVDPVIDRVFETGEAVANQEVEGETPAAPGVRRYWLSGFYPVRGADGGVASVGAWVTEITERKRAEQALEAERAKLEAVVAGMNQGVILLDPGGRVTAMNRAALAMHGFSDPSEMPVGVAEFADRFELRTPAGEVVSRESRPAARALRGERFTNEELEVRRRDGACRFVGLYSSAAVDDGAGGVRFAVLAVNDITRLKEASDALRRTEAQFGQLAEFIPQLAWMARPDGHIYWYNRRWYEFTGQPPADADGWGWQSVQHPDVLPDVVERWTRSLRTSEPFEMTFPLRGADGQYRRFLTRAAPFKDGDTILVWFGTNTDVEDQLRSQDERERLLREAQAAREQAEGANRMKDEFLATLSHELRTPLNAILGWTHILRSGQADDDDRREAVDVIERNARAQAQLVEDLLDISRIITGKLTLDVQRVDLAPVVAAAVDAVAPAAQARGVTLVKSLDPHPGPVAGDATRLQQVVWNLVSNAVKFTPRGGLVRVTLSQTDSHVEVSVADTGEGINPAFLPHVFDRFRQADASTTRRHGGLGLGLSIVKQLVEMHGGTVRVASPGVGQGATFLVTLPLTAPRPEAVSPISPASATAGRHHEADELAGLRVLVVDDEPDARVLMTRVLGGCGAEVATAATADDAIRMIGRFRPHVLVSDIGMPGRDGYDLLREVRSRTPAAELPAVALTAFARVEDRTRALSAGFQIHLAKPVDPGELVATVASLGPRPGGA